MGGRPASARAKSARPKSGRPGSAANKRCVGGDNTAALPFWGVVYGAREAGSAANKRCVGGDNTAALPFWGVVYGAREAGWGSGGERVALLAFSVSHPSADGGRDTRALHGACLLCTRGRRGGGSNGGEKNASRDCATQRWEKLRIVTVGFGHGATENGP
jgi:hypothetical protein